AVARTRAPSERPVFLNFASCIISRLWWNNCTVEVVEALAAASAWIIILVSGHLPWRRRSHATAGRRRVTSSSPLLLQRNQCPKIDSGCGRSGFIDQLFGRCFQFRPSRQRIGGRKDDVTKYAAPLYQRAFDIAVTQQFIGELVFAARISYQRAHHFRCAGAVLHRHAHTQITWIIGAAVNPLTQNAEPPAHRRVLTGEPRTGPNI